MPLYLGLDCSTQSLTAIVIDADGDRREVVFNTSVRFDEALPQYSTRHGVLPTTDPAVAVSPPLMWTDALDIVMGRVAANVAVSRLAAISGSAQQHGSVYMNAGAAPALARLDPARAPGEQLTGVLSRRVAPIWMDSSTSEECADIESCVGGAAELARRTGSRAFERFTGPQIRKFFKHDAAGYASTERIHLVSSFLASLLAGEHAPLDPGDASGMNMMDLASLRWWPPALDATAPDLFRRLPLVVPSWSVVGRLSLYWQTRHRLPPVKVVAWSGDNPCSLVGTGLVREGLVAISLGTSDTIFGWMRESRVDSTGTGHVFAAPIGGYMGMTVFKNGSLAREQVRDMFRLTWGEFSRSLAATAPGNGGGMLLPWFEPEITPLVLSPGVRRTGLAANDGAAHVRAIVEAQMMAMALHSRWMGVDIRSIYATGGASANRAILQVMADVFDADVYQFEVANSACVGAALRAFHADAASSGHDVAWQDVVRGIAEPVASSHVQPDRAAHAVYEDLIDRYAAFEGDVLSGSA
jgi:xylulokinase